MQDEPGAANAGAAVTAPASSSGGPRVPVAAAAVTGAVLLVAFVVTVVVTTPWHPLPGSVPGGHVPPDVHADFTTAEIARESAYHDAIRPWGLTDYALGILVPAALGLTPLGARLVRRLVGGRRWILQVPAAAVLVTVLSWLVTLPFAAREHAIRHEYGLTNQGWAGWLGDEGRGYAVVLVITTIALLAVMALARRFRRRWWLPVAVTGAALVVVGSFVYPLVVEPVFNRFQSLPAGQLRDDLLALAVRDHQPLRDILVADASRRTTTENAYVSGFGASRRLVLYDTLLAQDTPREVEVITAHELGHAKAGDVLHATLEGALAVATALCLGFLLTREGAALPRRVGATGAGDAKAVPLLLALSAVVGFAVTPLTNLVSRHIEARADAHALELTRDPATFIAAERQLARAGLSDLEPSGVLYVLFSTHPTAPQRIAMARDWERQHPSR